jgi:L-threonylcarbamoyladenylate synthase
MTLNASIIKIDPQLMELEKVKIVAQALLKEGIVVYPTETFYGLGACCLSKKAVKRIYRLKKRDLSKPLSVIISDLDLVEKIAVSIPPSFWILAQEFWPGPLTLVLKAAPQFPESLLGPGHSLGMRLPAIAWLRELVRQVASPITATSANISGEKEICEAEEIVKIFGKKVDLIVAGGKTQGILPSTVIDLTSEKPKILREGAIPKEWLKRYLKIEDKV